MSIHDSWISASNFQGGGVQWHCKRFCSAPSRNSWTPWIITCHLDINFLIITESFSVIKKTQKPEQKLSRFRPWFWVAHFYSKCQLLRTRDQPSNSPMGWADVLRFGSALEETIIRSRILTSIRQQEDASVSWEILGVCWMAYSIMWTWSWVRWEVM